MAMAVPENFSDPQRQRRIEDLLGRVNSQVVVLSTNTSQQMSELERRVREAENMLGQANTLSFKLAEVERTAGDTGNALRRDIERRSNQEVEVRTGLDQLSRRLTEVEENTRTRALALETMTESDKNDHAQQVLQIKSSVEQQQEVVATLSEALRQERENRLSLEEYTKREVEDSRNSGAGVNTGSDKGVRSVQKDLQYLEQIVRAEVKARQKAEQEGRQKTENLLIRVSEGTKQGLKQMEKELHRADDVHRTQGDELRRWATQQHAESQTSHFRAITDLQVTLSTLKKTQSQDSTKANQIFELFSAQLEEAKLRAESLRTAASAELQQMVHSLKQTAAGGQAFAISKVQRHSNKVASAVRALKDKLQHRLSQHSDRTEAVKEEAMAAVAHTQKSLRGSLAKVQQLMQNSDKLGEQRLDEASAQLFHLINTVRSSCRGALDEILQTTERNFEKRADAHVALELYTKGQINAVRARATELNDKMRRDTLSATETVYKCSLDGLAGFQGKMLVALNQLEGMVDEVEEKAEERSIEVRAELCQLVSAVQSEVEAVVEGLVEEQLHLDQTLQAEAEAIREEATAAEKRLAAADAESEERVRSAATEQFESAVAETAELREQTAAAVSLIAQTSDASDAVLRENVQQLGEDLREEAILYAYKAADELEAVRYEAEVACEVLSVDTSEQFEDITRDNLCISERVMDLDKERREERENDLYEQKQEFSRVQDEIVQMGNDVEQSIMTVAEMSNARIGDVALLQEEDLGARIEASVAHADEQLRHSEERCVESLKAAVAESESRDETLDKEVIRIEQKDEEERTNLHVELMAKIAELRAAVELRETDREESVIELLHATAYETEASVMAIHEAATTLGMQVLQLAQKQEGDFCEVKGALHNEADRNEQRCRLVVEEEREARERDTAIIRDCMVTSEEALVQEIRCLKEEVAENAAAANATLAATVDALREECLTEMAGAEDRAAEELRASEAAAAEREKVLQQQHDELVAAQAQMRQELMDEMKAETEGVRKVVAEAFGMLNTRMEKGFEVCKDEAEERQTALEQKIAEAVEESKEERGVLKVELRDEIEGSQTEAAAAVNALGAQMGADKVHAASELAEQMACSDESLQQLRAETQQQHEQAQEEQNKVNSDVAEMIHHAEEQQTVVKAELQAQIELKESELSSQIQEKTEELRSEILGTQSGAEGEEGVTELKGVKGAEGEPKEQEGGKLARALRELDSNISERMTKEGNDVSKQLKQLSVEMAQNHHQIIGDKTKDGELQTAIKDLHERINNDVEGNTHEITACVTALQKEILEGDTACKKEIQDLNADITKKLGSNGHDVADKLSALEDKIQSNHLEILGDASNAGELKRSITELEESLKAEIQGQHTEFGAAVGSLQEEIKNGATTAHNELQDLNVKVEKDQNDNTSRVESEMKELVDKLQLMRNEILGDGKNDGVILTSVKALENKLDSELQGTQAEFEGVVEALKQALSDQVASSQQHVQDLEVNIGEKMGSKGNDSEARMDELQGNIERIRFQILGDNKNDGDLKTSIKELHATINQQLDGTQHELGAAVEIVVGNVTSQLDSLSQQLAAGKEQGAKELSDAVIGCQEAAKTLDNQINDKVNSTNNELSERIDELQGKHLATQFQILGDDKNDGDLKTSIKELHDTINQQLEGTQSELTAALAALQKTQEKELSDQQVALANLGSELMGDDADGGGKLSDLKGE